jgi:predicted tellurium resistance membrane protein TerC
MTPHVTVEVLASLAALAGLEIVLGIDNIVFIAIMVERLPKAKRRLAYRLGLGGALVTRLLLLFTISTIMHLTEPFVTVLGRPIGGRDAILLGGGAFLVFKSSREMFEKVERIDDDDEDGPLSRKKKRDSMFVAVLQIMVLDIVFSLDSVITAVGVASELWAMATAMLIAVLVMMIFANRVGEFVNANPSMQVLALAFLLMIGVLLIAEGLGQHVNKATVYSAMGFALLVELMQLRRRRKIDRKHPELVVERSDPAAQRSERISRPPPSSVA